MAGRTSYTNEDGESTGFISQSDRWYGTALGIGGGVLTILMGSFLAYIAERLLTIGPGGAEVRRLIPFQYLSFLPGLWLVLPAGVAGYRIGFDRMLHFYSLFWGTADPPRRMLSTKLWAALLLTCVVLRWILHTVF